MILGLGLASGLGYLSHPPLEPQALYDCRLRPQTPWWVEPSGKLIHGLTIGAHSYPRERYHAKIQADTLHVPRAMPKWQ